MPEAAYTVVMNKFTTRKLRLSKWTAVKPSNREKHFIVTELLLDADENISGCVLEAVHSKREQIINWRDLQDSDTWRQGWK
jgi:tryptophan-rich hypothetical protein